MSKQHAGYRAKYVNPGVVRISSSFTTKSESVPTVIEGQTVATAGAGPGYTISAPAAAIYTITGSGGAFHRVVSAGCQIRDPLSTSTKACHFSEIVATTDPWTAKLVTQSADGTAATLSGPIVDWWIEFAETTLMR